MAAEGPVGTAGSFGEGACLRVRGLPTQLRRPEGSTAPRQPVRQVGRASRRLATQAPVAGARQPGRPDRAAASGAQAQRAEIEPTRGCGRGPAGAVAASARRVTSGVGGGRTCSERRTTGHACPSMPSTARGGWRAGPRCRHPRPSHSARCSRAPALLVGRIMAKSACRNFGPPWPCCCCLACQGCGPPEAGTAKAPRWGGAPPPPSQPPARRRPQLHSKLDAAALLRQCIACTGGRLGSQLRSALEQGRCTPRGGVGESTVRAPPGRGAGPGTWTRAAVMLPHPGSCCSSSLAQLTCWRGSGLAGAGQWWRQRRRRLPRWQRRQRRRWAGPPCTQGRGCCWLAAAALGGLLRAHEPAAAVQGCVRAAVHSGALRTWQAAAGPPPVAQRPLPPGLQPSPHRQAQQHQSPAAGCPWAGI